MADRVLPDKNTLRKWYDAGMTYQAMADLWEQQTDHRATRQAFKMACGRHGFPPRNLKHDELLPKGMRLDHQKLYDTEMIRRFSGRRQGKKFNAYEEGRLNSWLLNLRDAKVVLVYRRNTQAGWHPVPRRPTDDADLPVRLPKKRTSVA